MLKQFLVEKGLNDPYVGGLSSYALVIMLTAILKKHFPTGYPYPGAADLGVLFVDFLHAYSAPEFLREGVRLDGHFPDQRFARNLHDPVLIVDPLDPLNNVGRTCYGITQVVSAFSEALVAIKSADQLDEDNDSSILGRVFSTGHHRDVVDLVTKVWCPPELPSNSAAASSFQLPKRTASFGPLLQGSTFLGKPATTNNYVAALPWITSNAPLGHTAVDAWAKDAKEILEELAREVDAGHVFCPVCKSHSVGHAPGCPLIDLLNAFPSR